MNPLARKAPSVSSVVGGRREGWEELRTVREVGRRPEGQVSPRGSWVPWKGLEQGVAGGSCRGMLALEQLGQWTREGRAEAGTEVRSGGGLRGGKGDGGGGGVER